MNIARTSECEIKIRACYDQLPAADRRVADVILANLNKTLDYSLAELAYDSKVSAPTVVRFCHRVGYRGLKDLKISLAKTLGPGTGPPDNTDIAQGDDIAVVKQKVTYSILQSVQDTMGYLNDEDLKRAIDILRRARYIEIFGVGGSAMVARLAQHNFRKLGMRINLCTDPERDFYMAEQNKNDDITILAISVSGETESVLNAVKYAKAHGAVIISITGIGNSMLKEISDVCLSALSRSNIVAGDHSYVRLAQTGIIDLLFAGICAKG
ncbi:MAG: MurR/RpiR family transcriptional regulator [Clostridiales bacterium]|nr:MurR/RpiR family transcriptional regulator [Clostridiales bacterium]